MQSDNDAFDELQRARKELPIYSARTALLEEIHKRTVR